MTFTYSSYEKYVEAYKCMLRLGEPFSYHREAHSITVDNPDAELIDMLNWYK